MSGTPFFQAIVFLVHSIFCILMMVGYYTELSTFIVWMMTCSLHNRNLVVLHGGDILQRVVLFFALFLPLAECYSIDKAFFKKPKFRRDYSVLSIATLALPLQLCL